MSYTPFEVRVLPLFFYYIVLSIIGILMTLKMYYKWRERKVNPPLYLSIVFLSLTVALIMLTLGLAEAVITGFFMEIYRFSLPFAYGMVILADILLLKFVIELIDKGKKSFIPLTIVGLVICVILFLPWNWWGTPSEDYAGHLNIRLYSTLTLVLYSYFIYILIARTSLKAAKATQDATAKIGLKFLFYSMISLILFFLMFIGDTLMIALFQHPGYSEFIYIAWFFAILFFLFSYISLVMPKWVLKRIGK
ncbi:MAG: hypothetical protein KGD73_07055 [Candidatus Lokiarchaeota archaeon]|nr:hypothetical protein [Candidatus Lokiarchaeota archaeon]